MPQDFLGKECALQGLSIQEFQEAFCSRCLNKDCGRSIAGKSKFEQRVNSWEERLFTEVPRMAPNDPRFEGIHAQKFITLGKDRPYEVQSAWVDPRDLEEPPEIAKPAPVAPEIVKPAPEIVKPEPVPPEIVKPAAVEPSPPPPVRQPGRVLNTPLQQGQMLDGPKKPAKPRDPWEPPPTKTEDDGKIVEPGSRFRFGN